MSPKPLRRALLAATALGFALSATAGCRPTSPPASPLLSGPDSSLTGWTFEIHVATGMLDRETRRFRVDWGDGDTSAWSHDVAHDETLLVRHVWTSPGEYAVAVQARDTRLRTSDWSDRLAVRVLPGFPHVATDTVRFDGLLTQLAMLPGAQACFVTSAWGPHVWLVDTDTDTVVGMIETHNTAWSNETHAELPDAGDVVYISDYDNNGSIAAFRTSDLSLLHVFQMTDDLEHGPIAVSHDGTRLFAPRNVYPEQGQDDRPCLLCINATTGEARDTLWVDSLGIDCICSVALLPLLGDTTLLLLSPELQCAHLLRIDGLTKIDSIPLAGSALSAAQDRWSGDVFIKLDSVLLRFDPTEWIIRGRAAVGPRDSRVCLSHDGRYTLVAVGDRRNVQTGVGIIRAADMKWVATLPTPDIPTSFAASPDGRKIYAIAGELVIVFGY